MLNGDGDAEEGGHRSGTGIPGEAEFPPSWPNEIIFGEIFYVTTDPNSTTKLGREGAIIIEVTRDCVKIRSIVRPDVAIIAGTNKGI